MAENITMVSLRKALCAQANVTEKVADEFLRALFEAIGDGLKADSEVTVNGLGTFRLQEVAPRESVSIATGERFEIAGYNKVVFTADTRAPKLADKTPVPVKKSKKKEAEPIDPIQKLGEQAEEIKGILGELSAMGGLPADEPLPVEVPIEVPIEIPAPAEPVPAEEPQPEAVVPAPVEEAPVTEEKKQDKPEKKPFNPWLTTLITLIVFIMLLIAAYFFLRYKIIHWTDTMRQTIEQRVTPKQDQTPTIVAEPTEPPAEEAPAVETVHAETTTETVPATETKAPAKAINYFDDNERRFTDFKATEVVGKDSRLAWVAKKHYGEKAYWVFVYEANKDKLESPDFVMPGMELQIPVLPKELRNPNDPKTAELLARLSKKYLAVL